jgi:hypothetical protein
MARLFKSDEGVARRDELQCRGHFFDGTERIASAVNKERGSLQPRKVNGSRLLGFAGRMERIGKQKECVGDSGILRREHGCLSTAVGVAAKENIIRRDLAHRVCRALQTLAVALGVGALRRTGAVLLAVRKIATQDVKSGVCEGFGHGMQQRRLAVRSGSVGYDQTFAGRAAGRLMWLM